MICRCRELTELRGEDAKNYAHDHLREVEVRAAGWETVYECPDTKIGWLEDYPNSHQHGGGIVRLRRLDGSAGSSGPGP